MKSTRGDKKQRANALRNQIAALRSGATGGQSESSPRSPAAHAESPREFIERRSAELGKQAKTPKKVR